MGGKLVDVEVNEGKGVSDGVKVSEGSVVCLGVRVGIAGGTVVNVGEGGRVYVGVDKTGIGER